MSDFIVSKDSWHFKWVAFNWALSHASKFDIYWSDGASFVDTYVNYANYRPYNFCMYWRAALLWPTFRLGFAALLWAIILFCVTTSFQVVAVSIVGMLIAVGLIISALFAVNVVLKLISGKVSTSESFIGTAYNAYKNKFCPSISYVETRHEEK